MLCNVFEMKIVYFSETFFLDSDFPLVKQYQTLGHNVLFLITLTPRTKRGTLLDLKNRKLKDGIYPASDFEELDLYKDYLDFGNIYFVVRSTEKVLTFNYFRTMLKVFNVIAKYNPDRIHTTHPYNILESMLYYFRKKTILTMHDPFLHSGKASLRNNIVRALAIKFVPKFVLLNESQLDLFSACYKIDRKNICLNKLGTYEVINVFHSYRRQSETINILYFGHISSYKGIEYLCEAMLNVHKVYSKVKLIIAGGGKIYFDYSQYEKLDYIELKNHYITMQELSELLENSDFVVCPYKDATQSGVIMTSFAKKCPVIASEVGGLREQVKDNITGILVPPCNVKQLSQAILKLCNDSELLKKMRKNIESLNYSKDNSWKYIASRYIDFYNQDF